MRPPIATPPRGWVSCVSMNGAMIASVSSGPISTRTALSEALSASFTTPTPTTPLESASIEPTATVEGTSVSTAKKAISAAWPVVRCTLAASMTWTGRCHSLLPSAASVRRRATDPARPVRSRRCTPRIASVGRNREASAYAPAAVTTSVCRPPGSAATRTSSPRLVSRVV